MESFQEWLAAFEGLSFYDQDFHAHLAQGLHAIERGATQQAHAGTGECFTTGTPYSGPALRVVTLNICDPRDAREGEGEGESDAA